MKISNQEKGQSLFEVVVALAISALVIGTIVSLVTNSIRNSISSKNKSLASSYAQQATEWLRGQRDAGITTFKANINYRFGIAACFNSDPLLTSTPWPGTFAPCPASGNDSTIAGTPFARQITFLQDDGIAVINSVNVTKTIIKAVVTVSWTDSQGTHTVTNATSFSDWSQR